MNIKTIKDALRHSFCNNWRKLHGLPLVRRKKLKFKRFKERLIQEIDFTFGQLDGADKEVKE